MVGLRATDEVDFFVVPRNQAVGTVVAVMKNLPGNERGSRGPQEYVNFRDGWELMEQPAQEIECLVQPWVGETLTDMSWPHLAA